MDKTNMPADVQQQTETLISFRIPNELMHDLRVTSAKAGYSTVPKFIRDLIKQAVAKS